MKNFFGEEVMVEECFRKDLNIFNFSIVFKSNNVLLNQNFALEHVCRVLTGNIEDKRYPTVHQISETNKFIN